MVLPLIPLVIVGVSAATGAAGIGAGVWGGTQIVHARKGMQSLSASYSAQHAAHLAVVATTNGALRALGDVQERAQTDAIYRMKAFLERNAKQVRAGEHLILEGLDGTSEQVVGLAKLDADVASWVRGLVSSVAVGVGTPAAVRAGVVQLATSSTGTAISVLTGAAAESATLAWLGGGSLAAGGGGVALGGVVLNVAAIGPTSLVAGLAIKSRGTKAITEAERFRTEVEVELARLRARNTLLRATETRANELTEVLANLTNRATSSMDVLEAEPFDIETHATRLQRALVLVKSVRDVATAPVVNDQGHLHVGTRELILRYRNVESGKPDAL